MILYVLIGLVTSHVNEAFALATDLFFKRPFPTATKLSGTIMVSVAPLSGSSAQKSLQGYHNEAPSPSQATLIHGRPCLSFVQTQPPSHGGIFASLGFP